MASRITLIDDLVDFLLEHPSPDQIIAYTATEEQNERITELLKRNRNGKISMEERLELQRYLDINRAITRAKVAAFVQLGY